MKTQLKTILFYGASICLFCYNQAVLRAQSLAPEPTAQPSQFTRTAVSSSGFTVQWSPASQTDGYLVLRTVSTSAVFPNTDPSDGVVYALGAVLGNATVVAYGADVSLALSTLNANERHNFKVYSFNGSGASVNYLTSNPLQGSAYTLVLPPTAQASVFSATTTANPGVNLLFSAAQTLPASGYIILRKESPFLASDLPIDGQAYATGAVVGGAVVSHIVTNTVATTETTVTLSGDKTYYQCLVPYNQGLAADTRNYHTDGAPTLFFTTPSVGSDIVAIAGSEATTIGSLINDMPPLSASTGVQVWQLRIRDGGALLNDADALPTVVQQLTLTQNAGNAVDVWSEAIQTAALFDGTTWLASAIVSGSTLFFDQLNVSVPDGTSKVLTLRLSLKGSFGTNIDGDDFVFNLTKTNVVVAASGSLLSNFTTASSANGANVLDAVASALVFTQQPSQTYQNVAMSPALMVMAQDVYGNRDYGFTQAVRLRSSGSLLGGTVSVAAVSGVATFSQVVHQATGLGLILTADRAASADFTVNSGLFDIIALSTAVFIQNMAWLSPNNWSPAGIPLSVQVAQFNTVAPATVTIAASSNNLSSGRQGVGAIELTALCPNDMTIRNGSSTAGLTLVLAGAVVDGVSNVILKHNGAKNLTLSDGTSRPMVVDLGNETLNKIVIQGAGSVFIGSAISGTDKQLSIEGAGTGGVELSGMNTFSGLTTLSGATLRLNRAGGNTLPATNSITINGGVFRVSSNQTLQNITLLSGTLVVDAGVVLTVTGQFLATGGTLNIAGTLKLSGTNMVFPGTGTIVSQLSHLTIDVSAGVSLSQSLTIAGTLTLLSGRILLGDYDLTIAATGSISGGHASAFIVTDGHGRLVQRVTTVPTVFPIGSHAGAYRPLTMQMVTGVADYAAHVYPYVAQGSGNRVNLVWRTQRLAQDASPHHLTFQWETIDESAPLGQTLSLFRNTSSTGSFVMVNSASKMGVNPFTLTINDVPDAYDANTNTDGDAMFIIADGPGSTVLPVVLKSFDVSSEKGANRIVWETASEEKMAYFEVERRDGQSAAWRVLGRVKAYNQAAVYTLSDATPLSMGYYRLKMVDLDGTMRYSKTIAIARMATTAHDLEVFPNPTSYEVSVRTQLSQEGLVTYRLIDLAGRVHYSTQVQMAAGEQMTTLDVAHLPAGTYILEVQSVSKTERARIMKQ